MLRFRPLAHWDGSLSHEHRPSPFTASYTDTLELLERELRYLGADEAVLQVAVDESAMRVDGGLRANARPSHPGVRLSFQSRWGPLTYQTDTFDHWQVNLRAIGLGLESLRRVDRFGIGRSGEQYRGWNALPQGAPMGPAMTVDEAAQLLATEADFSDGSGPDTPEARRRLAERLLADPETYLTSVFRRASKRHHPDLGGDPIVFRRLTEARDLIAGTRR